MAHAEMEGKSNNDDHPFDPATAIRNAGRSQYVEPSINDILLGRGSSNSWRPGHTLMHNLVDEHLETYHSTTRRTIKGELIKMVYDRIKSTGARFLRKVSGTDNYVEVSEAQAKEKISHTFRDRRNAVEGPTRSMAQHLASARGVTSAAAIPSSSSSSGVVNETARQEGGAYEFDLLAENAHDGVDEEKEEGDVATDRHGRPDSDEESLFSTTELASVLGRRSEYR